jgi:hypothetical protein
MFRELKAALKGPWRATSQIKFLRASSQIRLCVCVGERHENQSYLAYARQGRTALATSSALTGPALLEWAKTGAQTGGLQPPLVLDFVGKLPKG